MAEDKKFTFVDGRFINRVSGEAIPDDEPVMLFRARDKHALAAIIFYRYLISDEHHQMAVEDRIAEFALYQKHHPEQMKEPGITRDMVLNSDFAEIEPRVLGTLYSEGQVSLANGVDEGGKLHVEQVEIHKPFKPIAKCWSGDG